MNEPPEGLRIGIAGTGLAGRLHARAALLAGARVTAVAASSPERAERAAAELGAERACEDAIELATADGLDVVHVCTPNHLHLPVARAALEAGKHVVCEKPLAIDLDGARELAEAAGRAATVATVPFVYRFYATVREARARVRAGELGPLRLIHGAYLQDWLAAPGASNWRTEAALGGRSGTFADVGSHWCDLAEFVSGERIARLCARIAATAGHETEDVVALVFETAAGTLGSAAISQVAGGHKNGLWLELAGAGESVRFEQERPDELWVGRQPAVEIVPRGPDTLLEQAARYATVPAGHPQGYAECFEAFVADTYAAIRGQPAADGLPVFADGMRAAELTEAVLASAAARAWVEVGPGEGAGAS